MMMRLSKKNCCLAVVLCFFIYFNIFGLVVKDLFIFPLAGVGFIPIWLLTHQPTQCKCGEFSNLPSLFREGFVLHWTEIGYMRRGDGEHTHS